MASRSGMSSKGTQSPSSNHAEDQDRQKNLEQYPYLKKSALERVEKYESPYRPESNKDLSPSPPQQIEYSPPFLGSPSPMPALPESVIILERGSERWQDSYRILEGLRRRFQGRDINTNDSQAINCFLDATDRAGLLKDFTDSTSRFGDNMTNADFEELIRWLARNRCSQLVKDLEYFMPAGTKVDADAVGAQGQRVVQVTYTEGKPINVAEFPEQ